MNLLQDSSLYHKNGKLKGRPIFSTIAEKFLEQYPSSHRTIVAIRKQARQLFESDATIALV